MQTLDEISLAAPEPAQHADRVAMEAVLERLSRWGAERSWVGPDPYEGLNTPLARVAPGIRGRQAVVQAYKRLPFGPPWPLSAPRRPNSKTLALALSAYATAAGARLPESPIADSLVLELSRLRIPVAGGWGWGYHFDLQTRHLLYYGSAPNAVATSFVVGGLLDTHERTDRAELAELALGSRPFLDSLLQRDPAGPYFGYVAKGSRLIHNANLLVCATIARLHELAPDDALAGRAAEAAATTIQAQDDDGLWPYGASGNLSWADNFHTAYILESLVDTDRVLGVGAQALNSGLSAWRSRFFEADASARLYPHKRFPLEAHSFASAIDLCCAARECDPSLIGFARRVAQRAIDLLWMPNEGRFAYRVSRLGRNRRGFVRWTNAPMFRALTRLLSEPSEG